MNEIGAAAAGSALNFGSNIALSGINYAFNKKLAQEAREENYKYGEMAADAADARTRGLYNDLYGIEAQMRQIKNAGLSPSLMYGGGAPSSGGLAGAQGGGAAGVSAAGVNVAPVDFANITKAMADAKLANAQADTLNGKNERGAAEIAGILLQNAGQKAATAFTDAQTKGQQLQNMITEATKDFTINKAESVAKEAASNAEKAVSEAKLKGLEFDFKNDTYEVERKKVYAQYENIVADTLLKKSEHKLNEARVKEVDQHIRQMYNSILQEWERLHIDNQAVENQQEWWTKQINYELEKLGIDKELTEAGMEIQHTKMWIDFAGHTMQTAGNIAMILSIRNPQQFAGQAARTASEKIAGATKKAWQNRRYRLDTERNIHVE